MAIITTSKVCNPQKRKYVVEVNYLLNIFKGITGIFVRNAQTILFPKVCKDKRD